ncbi:MAG: hypothetical protein ACR2NP_04935, partial [Pirellulaceae bacterium]
MPTRFFHRWLAICALLLASLANTQALAGGGPENVLVVVNRNSPDSLAVANLFVHMRNIPPGNVVYLDRVPEGLVCEFEEFRDQILKPVTQAISQRNLDRQIDCVVYSAGFPTAVDTQRHADELLEKRNGLDRRLFGPRCSINALTWFYGEVLGDSPSYMMLNANWYQRRVVSDFLQRPFIGELQQEFEAVIELFESGDHAKASRQLAGIVEQHPRQVAARYWLVRSLAAEGKTSLALRQLKLCIATGWCYSTFTGNDDLLDSLHDDPQFDEIVATAPDLEFGELPTTAFSNRLVWSINGWPNNQVNQGKRFVLSTVLAVTRGRGTTLQQALEQIATSVNADFTKPQGTFYFMRTADVRTQTRKGQFDRAINELQDLGFGAEVVNQVLPAGRKDVLGATMGAARILWEESGNEFLPGAFADNLTSYGGVLTDGGSQTPITDFIAAGAAGASGTVIEPLSIPFKFPDARLQVHYARGCSLAEAFYQSVAAPFQLLLVGDPLCRPWAVPPIFEVAGVDEGQTVSANVELTFSTDADGPELSRYELFFDGVLRAATTPDRSLSFDSRQLSDGYHELRLVAVD